ncbi:MAG: lysine--tRNA ligase [Planctomycetota bacterium]
MSSENEPSTEISTSEYERQRLENREAVRALGLDPYGGRRDDLMPLAQAWAAYDEASDKAHQESVAAQKATKKDNPDISAADLPALVDDRPRVSVAGRVKLHRDGGKLIWMNLRDDTRESFQIAVSKKDCDEQGFGVAKKTDLGDIIIAEGPLMKTMKGEVTLWASSVRPASKSLVVPPAKHEGLADIELRYRQRYIDLWATPQTMRTFQLRSKIVAAVRKHLESEGFVEVETPMLQVQAGGAAARPFETHMNALDIPLYMRIAPELYLKRLLVGGMPRVFEINRNFRNEGLDKQHNPEFTMVELYQAFGDYHTVMGITEGIVRAAATLACRERAGEDGVDAEGLFVPWGDISIDFGSPFERVTYAELFERVLGFPTSDIERARSEAESRGIKLVNESGERLDDLFVINELFEDVAEPTLDPGKPTWIMDYPSALSPLTRPKPSDLSIAERADLFVGGMEIGPHYTELNDPDVQESKFRGQLAGIDDEESTFRTFDADFVRALKVGMPPAGGMGLGIDRLTMVLTNQQTIRDVILFPMMRPEA